MGVGGKATNFKQSHGILKTIEASQPPRLPTTTICSLSSLHLTTVLFLVPVDPEGWLCVRVCVRALLKGTNNNITMCACEVLIVLAFMRRPAY